MASIDSKSTSKTLFKNTGIIAIGQISTRLVNFFLLPLYTALLSKEEYGLVDLLSTYSSLVVVIVGLQFSQAVFRFLVTCRDDEEKTTKVVSTVSVATAIAALVYSILFCLFQRFIHLEYKWYLLVHVIAVIYLQTTSSIARGFGNNAAYATGNFISATIALVLNVIAIAVLHLGVPAMLVSYIIGPVIGGSFILLRCREWKYISVKCYSKDEFESVVKYALPLVPNELSWSVIHTSDRVVISSFLGVAVNGLVAVSAKFSSIYTTFFSIFNTSWTEQVVLHYKDDGGAEYISDMFDKMVSFFGCVAIGIISCMPFVFGLFVNAQFSDAYNLVPLYMIAVFFNAVIGMVSAIYLIENETKQVAVSTMGAAAINLFVDIIFINVLGMYAAPVSSICGYAAMSFWRLYDINRRHCRIGMPLRKVLMLLAALAISLVGFYCGSKVIAGIALAVIVIISILVNKSFLSGIISLLVERVK